MRLALIAASVACLLWSLTMAVGMQGLFAGDRFGEALRASAIVATGLAAILAGGWAIDELAFARGLHVSLTGLSRVLVYGGLTFAVSATVMHLLGFDIGAVLTTSAILTAVVGLAMQPTLGSFVSGLMLQADRKLRVGGAIQHNGRRLTIESLNWRNAVLRRPDGMLVVMPNATLANEPLLVYPEDGPLRCEAVIPAPIGLAPGRVADILREPVAEMPWVDPARPVVVMPVEFRPDIAAARYAVRFHVRDYVNAEELTGEAMRRCWYALARHGVAMPASLLHMPLGADAAPPAASDVEIAAALA
ncbi:MAG: mechanosensitive ion channel family protein, partial [Rubrimonas sp.]